MNLASQMRFRKNNLAEILAQKNKKERERCQEAEAILLRQQIEEAPKVAEKIIQGLPEFLNSIGSKNNRAYVLDRDACLPKEDVYPDYEAPSRNADTKKLSEYKVRRYLRGTVQHVAKWGLKQGFSVGLVIISSRMIHDWEIQERCNNIPFPVYMPGMLHGYIPTGNSEILYFAW